MKYAGILMPVASLSSTYGVGDFGGSSYKFLDLLHEAGINIWQILPLNPLGFGNSPYQPYSSYAGDEIYISPDVLVEEGLITAEELGTQETKKYIECSKQSNRIDYQSVRKFKSDYLHIAFQRFHESEEYLEFIAKDWVYIYAVFLSLKKQNRLVCWNEWPMEQQNWIKDRNFDLTPYENDIQYEMFVQYEFQKQWKALKAYANQYGIKIMGDLPFYVGIDSQDVWQNQEEFLLDTEGRPVFIAGVPPDYFSVTGQRWGNPIYNWDIMKENQYQFWMKRLSYCNEVFDITRIDHFRAFDTYWKIPSSCETAEIGEWVEAPGMDFFQKLLGDHSDFEIVVEDLGDLREQVHELRDYYHFKGMKVLQFAFDPKETNNNFEDKENMIVYTGTHDNQTIRGWFESQEEELQGEIKDAMLKLGYMSSEISWNFIEMALDSISEMVIVPYQDYINLNDEGRINTPGTLGSPNWEWKINDFDAFIERIPAIRKIIREKKITSVLHLNSNDRKEDDLKKTNPKIQSK